MSLGRSYLTSSSGSSRWMTPQAGGVPADGTPTLKSVGYRIRVARIL